MTPYLTPKMVQSFSQMVEGAGFKWLSATAPVLKWKGKGEERKLIEIPSLDNYELYPAPPTGWDHKTNHYLLDLTWSKASVMLIEMLPDYYPTVGEVTEDMITVIKRSVYQSYRLSLPLYVGPFAPQSLMEELTVRYEYPNQAVPTHCIPNRKSVRYKFGEKVTVINQNQDWTEEDGPKERKYPAYFLTTYRRPSGIGGYRVVKEVPESTHDSAWKKRSGSHHEYFSAGSGDERRYFRVVSVSKIEKFYPEGN